MDGTLAFLLSCVASQLTKFQNALCIQCAFAHVCIDRCVCNRKLKISFHSCLAQRALALTHRAMPQSEQSKTWVFTVNNWNDKDIDWVNGLECNRIVVSKEVGAEGTPHLQGAVTFKRNYSLMQLKVLHNKAHWEIARAITDFNYCKKFGGEVVRDESFGKQGRRTDIEDVREMLEAGESMSQISKKAKSMHSLSFAKQWLQINEQHLPLGTRITVHWYYGCSGVGKTKRVLDQCEPFIPLSFKWWDGYDGQKAVLLDDLRPDWCKPAELLRLLDPYRFQYRVEIKGSSKPLLATDIYITCPWHPDDFWKDSPEDPNQLLRRIDELLHIRSDGAWVKPTLLA